MQFPYYSSGYFLQAPSRRSIRRSFFNVQLSVGFLDTQDRYQEMHLVISLIFSLPKA